MLPSKAATAPGAPPGARHPAAHIVPAQGLPCGLKARSLIQTPLLIWETEVQKEDCFTFKGRRLRGGQDTGSWWLRLDRVPPPVTEGCSVSCGGEKTGLVAPCLVLGDGRPQEKLLQCKCELEPQRQSAERKNT